MLDKTAYVYLDEVERTTVERSQSATLALVERIPQRELRNSVSRVLRRAEKGERLEITVDGRPVAELGPLSRPAGLGSAEGLSRILADAPVDRGWAEDLLRMRATERGTARDPWAG